MFEDDFLIFKVEYVSFLEGIYHIFFQVEAKIYIYVITVTFPLMDKGWAENYPIS